MKDYTWEGPYKSECIKSNRFIDLDWDNIKGNLWLLAIWQEEQKLKLDGLPYGALYKLRILETIERAGCPSRGCHRLESTWLRKQTGERLVGAGEVGLKGTVYTPCSSLP